MISGKINVTITAVMIKIALFGPHPLNELFFSSNFSILRDDKNNGQAIPNGMSHETAILIMREYFRFVL